MTDRPGPRKQDDPIEVNELPSLPDGGLSANMPSWLRQAPGFNPPPVEASASGSAIDPGSLTRGLELPEWLHELSARVERGEAGVSVSWSAQTVEAEADLPSEDDAESSPPAPTTDDPLLTPVPTELEAVQADPIPAVPERIEPPVSPEAHVEPPYGRIGFLLILFAIGVIIFTIWSATN